MVGCERRMYHQEEGEGSQVTQHAKKELWLKTEGIIYSNRIVVAWGPEGMILDDSQMFKVGQ